MSRHWSVGGSGSGYRLYVEKANPFWTFASGAWCGMFRHKPSRVCGLLSLKESNSVDLILTLDITEEQARSLSPDLVAIFEED